VKPANLLLDHRGRIRVIDFGVARVVHGQAKAVADGTTEAGHEMVGTPRYMAPEQFEGEAAGASADVYALAVTFYEVVTGELPFETPRAKLVDSPAPPGSRIPEPLASAVLAALARDPAARPQDMDELAASWREAAATLGG
jgi:serine/threonine-protein kinase